MRDKAKYPVSNGHHEIEECQVFFSHTMEGRSLVISLKKHNGKICNNRRMCKVCIGWHPTTLHDLKIQKHKKKENTEDTDTKEDKPEEVKYA